MVQTSNKPINDIKGVFDFKQALANLLEERESVDSKLITKAANFVMKAHDGQKRLSGEPYVSHLFIVAQILNQLNLDKSTICAALLHDVVEDTDVNLEQVEAEFSAEIAKLVDGVTKMDLIHEYPNSQVALVNQEKQQAENLRKLLLAMVDDVRVVLIKLADRLHNMRTLVYLPHEKQSQIAKETLSIFAPLANRLGIWQIKWELEDLSLRYIEPESYKKIAGLLDEKRIDREHYIEQVIVEINQELQANQVTAEVNGRPKHIYSIWKKMTRKGVDFHELFDVRAVRIMVDSVKDCYAALGVVHSLWRHIPKEFDDYIATPKENDYQSLHTAVIGPESKTLEIQIRTKQMHEHSELGVAAHWLYKEGGQFDAKYEAKINWLRQILDWKEEASNADSEDLIDRFKAEVFQDRVYVLTPNGKVIDLPAGATPLDFAYVIHTDLGHRCRGAKIDGHIVPLTYELKSGEQIEILTTRSGEPSRDWLNPHLGYLKSSRSRSKVRTWFRHLDLDKNIAEGKSIIDKELQRVGFNNVSLKKLTERFQLQHVDEFLAMVGRGELTSSQIVNAAQLIVAPEHEDTEVLRTTHYKQQNNKPGSGDIEILGVGNLLTNMAKCCKPVPNDAISGYITRGRGVTIHRQNCPNVLGGKEEDAERLIEVSWINAHESSYPVDVRIEAYDRHGLLRDITAILSADKINVLAVNTLTDVKDHMAKITLTLEIESIEQLSKVLSKINQLPNIVDVQRKR